jgi:uncharacterized repeat protein (TIGR02543 family)
VKVKFLIILLLASMYALFFSSNFIAAHAQASYTVTVFIQALPPSFSTNVYVDNSNQGAVFGGGSKTLNLSAGPHIISVDQYVSGLPGTRYHCTSYFRPVFVSENVTFTYQTEHYLTVSSPYGNPGGAGWYEDGTIAYATLQTGIVPGPTGVRYVFTGWSGDASGAGLTSNPILMNGPKTAIANWKTQCLIVFTTSGLPTGVSVTITVNGVDHKGITPYAYAEWYDLDSSLTFSILPLNYTSDATLYKFGFWRNSAGQIIPIPQAYVTRPDTFTATYITMLTFSITTNGLPSGYTLKVWVRVNGGSEKVYNISSGSTVKIGMYALGSSIAYRIDDGNQTILIEEGKRYAFANWQPSSPVTLSDHVVATANYKIQWKLTVATSGLSSSSHPTTITINGTAVGTAYDGYPLSTWCDEGKRQALGVNSTISGSSGSRYVFVNWDDRSTNNTIALTLTAAATRTAYYKTQFCLTINSPYGSPSGAGWYDAGAYARAALNNDTVSGEAGGVRYVFTGWSGDASGAGLTSNPILMNGPKTAIANWKTQYYLAVNSIYGNPKGSGWYDASSKITFSVTSPFDHGNQTRRVFTGWTGDYTGLSPVESIVMDGPKSVTASWKTQFYLRVDSKYGNPKGEGWYDAGSKAVFNVTSPYDTLWAHCEFERWSGDYSGESNSGSIVMDKPHVVKAEWKVDYTRLYAIIGGICVIGIAVSLLAVKGIIRVQPFFSWLKGKFKRIPPKTPSPHVKVSPQTGRLEPTLGVKRCMQCGADLPVEAEFCDKCGKKQEQFEDVKAIDEKVYNYIVDHGGVISWSQASKELGISIEKLKASTERLKKSGKLG